MTKQHNYYIEYITRYLNANNLKAAKVGAEELYKLLQEELIAPKSGDRYEHINSSGFKVIYTLQKLPDYDLWCLVRDTITGMTYWNGPSEFNKCGVEVMRKIS